MDDPHYATPGEGLAALLGRYNQPPEVLAESLQIPRGIVIQIIENHIPISAELALRLGRATNTQPEYWLEMQDAADLRTARGRLGRSLSRITPLVAAAPAPQPPAPARPNRPVSKVNQLAHLAREWAASHAGDFMTNGHRFEQVLRDLAILHLGRDDTGPLYCGNRRMMIDYYFRDERTAVVVALDLPTSPAAFDHAAIKCLMAADEGILIERLVLLTRRGAAWTLSEREPTGIAAWLLNRHGIEVDIRELSAKY
jgi:addiction module HigA family antidote